jgi:hypothetical protein
MPQEIKTINLWDRHFLLKGSKCFSSQATPKVPSES